MCVCVCVWGGGGGISVLCMFPQISVVIRNLIVHSGMT